MIDKPVVLYFRIIGKPWRLRALSREAYDKKKIRAGSVAITYMHKRRIDLSPEGFDKESILHELVHAYLSEICVHSANLTVDNLEEIFCELMSKRGREILDLADTLVSRLKKSKVTEC